MKRIFILHGWTYSFDKWTPFINCLKSKNFDPVILPVPGLTEKSDKVWTLDNYIEWLKNKLDSEQSIVIGHSNGGRIALSFAAYYPEKIKCLILIDSAGIYHNELPIRLKRLVFGAVAKIGKRIISSERLRNILYKIARENDYNNATSNMKQTMANLISDDLTAKLSAITTPTLIIWGKHDTYTPLSDGKLMHSLIKNSKLLIIEDAHHSPQFTHAQKVSKYISEEIEKL